jgi:Cys-rich four helix bundle protein (predicted Tat secretion target)
MDRNMNRREIVAVGATLMTMSGAALAQGGHSDHAEAGHLLDTASDCVKAGLVCIDHCLQAFAAGDSSFAACARVSDQMVSMCGTVAKLASVKSAYLSAMAKVALAGCLDCETECRKHADKHPACKACAEACAAWAAECKISA